MRVCQKVRAKGVTTYNEVAAELVEEITGVPVPKDGAKKGEQKNIRRRVYDALNVLMALDIIKRDKKVITWLGLPSNDVMQTESLRTKIEARETSIVQKQRHLEELLTQVLTLKNLVDRNARRKARKARKNLEGESFFDELDTEYEPEDDIEENRLYLPFIVSHTPKETVIDCEMSEQRDEFYFTFSQPFSIHDDNEVLKRMGMQFMGPGNIGLIPPALRQYVTVPRVEQVPQPNP